MPFNAELVEAITSAIPPWLALFVFLFSYLGSIYVIAPSVIAAYLWGDRERTATWLGIIIAAYALFVLAKPLFDIPRPDVEPPLAREVFPTVLVPLYDLAIDFDTGSFPSGHAVVGTVFWGLFVVDLRVSTFERRLFVGIVMTFLVGFSRVGLGIHYVEDVVGGILMGLGLLAVMLAVRERTSDPMTAILVLALVPVAGAAFIGQVINAAVLFLAIVGSVVAHAKLGGWQPWTPTVRE